MNDAINDTLRKSPLSLYEPEEEHDSCGVGFVAAIDGQRSNRVLRLGLTSVCNMAHRGAMDADSKTGDGSGVLTQIPYKIFRTELAKLGHTLYNDTDLGIGFLFQFLHGDDTIKCVSGARSFGCLTSFGTGLTILIAMLAMVGALCYRLGTMLRDEYYKRRNRKHSGSMTDR